MFKFAFGPQQNVLSSELSQANEYAREENERVAFESQSSLVSIACELRGKKKSELKRRKEFYLRN